MTQLRPISDHRLWLREEGQGPDVDPLRDPRVPRAGDHPQQSKSGRFVSVK